MSNREERENMETSTVMNKEFIKGTAKSDDRLVILINIARLMET